MISFFKSLLSSSDEPKDKNSSSNLPNRCVIDVDKFNEIEIPTNLKNIKNNVHIHVFELTEEKCLSVKTIDESIFDDSRVYLIIDILKDKFTKKTSKTYFLVSTEKIDKSFFNMCQIMAEKLVSLDEKKKNTTSNLVIVSSEWRPERFDEILKEKSIKHPKNEWLGKMKDWAITTDRNLRRKWDKNQKEEVVEDIGDESYKKGSGKKDIKPFFSVEIGRKELDEKNMDNQLFNGNNISTPALELNSNEKNINPINNVKTNPNNMEKINRDIEMPIKSNDKMPQCSDGEQKTNPSDKIKSSKHTGIKKGINKEDIEDRNKAFNIIKSKGNANKNSNRNTGKNNEHTSNNLHNEDSDDKEICNIKKNHEVPPSTKLRITKSHINIQTPEYSANSSSDIEETQKPKNLKKRVKSDLFKLYSYRPIISTKKMDAEEIEKSSNQGVIIQYSENENSNPELSIERAENEPELENKFVTTKNQINRPKSSQMYSKEETVKNSTSKLDLIDDIGQNSDLIKEDVNNQINAELPPKADIKKNSVANKINLNHQKSGELSLKAEIEKNSSTNTRSLHHHRNGHLNSKEEIGENSTPTAESKNNQITVVFPLKATTERKHSSTKKSSHHHQKNDQSGPKSEIIANSASTSESSDNQINMASVSKEEISGNLASIQEKENLNFF